MRPNSKDLLALSCLFLVATITWAQNEGGKAPAAKQLFTKTVAQIPMRDGKTLNTEIYVPKSGHGDWPILLERTPYGIGQDDDGYFRGLTGRYAELLQDGYIFVIQDIRGRYGSEGTFVMQRPPRTSDDPQAPNESGIDEGTDTWDTIEWLLENVEGHNHRVGMLGISYGGWLTTMALIEPHPNLRAASPQASPSDMFKGDDFLHNGAFRLAASFGYVALMETGTENAPFEFDQHDAYEWYLELGPLANVDELYFFGEKPTWNDFMANTSYTEYWQRQTCLPYLEDVHLPTLNVAGWWDAEDFYGPMSIYQRFEESDDRDQNFLVVGPWRHGGWARGDGSSLGAISFDSATSRHFREQIERAFFAHYLIDGKETPFREDEALVFETGRNLWRGYEQWPPPAEAKKLYPSRARSLGFHPTRRSRLRRLHLRPGETSALHAAADSTVLARRGRRCGRWPINALSTGAPMSSPMSRSRSSRGVVIAGPVEVALHASTSGSDADWIVKLIDVFPEDYPERDLRGYQLMIADEVFRARFRESFESPRAVPSDKPLQYDFSLGDRHHRFERGHRIMVQVQSTWFPLIGRNPQTFVEIPEASETDYRPAEHRIFREPERPSHISLRVIP